jgi:hypothetical protein
VAGQFVADARPQIGSYANRGASARWEGLPLGAEQTIAAFVRVVSQQLAKLRLAGLVKTRRDGTFVYYSPAPDRDVLRVLSQALVGADEPQPISTA